MIYYITGGERSGKSKFAQNLALSLSKSPVYVATARKWDNDFEKRIKRHRDDRDENWQIIEEEKQIGSLNLTGQTVLIDCITLWLTNLYVDSKNVEETLFTGKKELTQLFQTDSNLLIISNEIGMGVHAPTEMGRKFTELQGWINQFIATHADVAFFMVSGIPIIIKGSHEIQI